MSAITGPRALRLVVTAIIAALLAAGCGSAKPASPASPAPSRSSPASPAPISAADLAWIQSLSQIHKKADKPFMAGRINMTRAMMNQLGDSLRLCRSELKRLGPPSSRLQPAYQLALQACRVYAKGARCFARAASVSDAAGAVIAGSPQERIQRRANACGFAAQGNGSNMMSEAEARAAEIRARFP